MRGGPSKALPLCIALVVAIALAGCGGDDDSASEGTVAQGGSTQQQNPSKGGDSGGDGIREKAGGGSGDGGSGGGSAAGGSDGRDGDAPDREGDTEGSSPDAGQGGGGNGAAEFRVRGSDNSVPDFGEEGTTSERDQAAAVLRGYLKAQEDEDWGAACARLSSMIRRQLEQLATASKQAKDCAGILAGLSAGLPRRSRASFARAEVASLRVEGNRAFALYHGAGGADYYMPMAKDGTEWKVASIAGTALP